MNPMMRYIIKRLLWIPVVLFFISLLSFSIYKLAPGDYFSQLAMNPQISPETLEQMRVQWGLDKPVYIQYFLWLWQVLHGNLGTSIAYNTSVTSLILSRAFSTMILSVFTIFFTWTLAIPMGIIVALRPNTFLDRSLSVTAFIGMSIPNFFLAFLLLYLALKTGWFPIGGTFSLAYSSLPWWGKIADRARHLIIPTIVLGTAGMAGLMRLMRAQMLEIKNADFITACRAKGLSERKIVLKHMLRNVLNPFVTSMGYLLSVLFSGAALTEMVLGLQGLGQLMLKAVLSQDWPLVMGVLPISSALLLLGILLADILLTVVDPRISFEALEKRR